MSTTQRCGTYSLPRQQYSEGKKLTDARDDLVDNFSTHQDEVEKLLSEGVKKLGLNGR
jgi:hypothetical protein